MTNGSKPHTPKGDDEPQQQRLVRDTDDLPRPLLTTGQLHREQRARADGQSQPTAPSVSVAGSLGGNPDSVDWMGWPWRGWVPVVEACQSAGGAGLYRLRTAGSGNGVGLYVGQGNIAARLRVHVTKAARRDHRQRELFSGELEASWVELPGNATVNLLEHENDLVAAHVLTSTQAPRAQFLG